MAICLQSRTYRWLGMMAIHSVLQMVTVLQVVTAEDPIPADSDEFARLQEVIPSGWQSVHLPVDVDADAAALVLQAGAGLGRLPHAGALSQAIIQATTLAQPVAEADVQILSPWIAQQADALFLFHRAAHGADFNEPALGGERRFAQVCVDLARTVVVAARLHAYRHENDQAWQAADDLLRFAETFHACLNGAGDGMPGTVVQTIAYRLISRLAVDCYDPVLISAQLQHLGGDRAVDIGRIVRQFVIRPGYLWSIAAMPESGAEWAQKLRAGYRHSEHTLRAIGVTPEPLADMLSSSQAEIPIIASHPRVLNRIATLRMQIAWARVVASSSHDGWAQARRVLDGPDGQEFVHQAGFASDSLLQPWSQPEAGSAAQMRMLDALDHLLNQDDNALGVLLSARLAIQVKAQISLAIDVEAMRRLTRLALAVALTAKGRDQLPRQTSGLIMPGIFTTIPEDPYDSRPLRYDAVRHVAWSVGQDLNDDGGNPRRDICFALSADPDVWLGNPTFSTPSR